MTFPSLRPILERLAYTCYLVLLVGSIGFTWVGGLIGMETGNYMAMCLPLGGLALTRWLHLHGHAHWHFEDCKDALDRFGTVGPWRSEREELLAVKIAALFARLEAEDDVWVRGDLRREIAAKLAAAPALRSEFAETLKLYREI